MIRVASLLLGVISHKKPNKRVPFGLTGRGIHMFMCRISSCLPHSSFMTRCSRYQVKQRGDKEAGTKWQSTGVVS